MMKAGDLVRQFYTKNLGYGRKGKKRYLPPGIVVEVREDYCRVMYSDDRGPCIVWCETRHLEVLSECR